MTVDVAQIESLLYESESDMLDFKAEQYKFEGASDKEKGELLKDILAFTNSWRRTDAFILVGVKENPGKAIILGIKPEEHIDDAKLQQFVNGKTQRPVKFNYSVATIDGMQIGVICIQSNTRPIYLRNDFGKLKANKVYIRRGSSTAEATPDEIIEMGKIQDRSIPPIIDVSIHSTSNYATLVDTKHIQCKVESHQVAIEEIPDYEGQQEYHSLGEISVRIPVIGLNINYYREMVEYIQKRSLTIPIYFKAVNKASVVANDIKMRIVIPDAKNRIAFLSKFDYESEPEKNDMLSIHAMRNISTHDTVNEAHFEQDGDSWVISVHFGKIQPGDVSQSIFAYLFIKESCALTLDGKIFGDDIPQPIAVQFKLETQYEKFDANVDSFVDWLNESHGGEE